MGLNHAGVNNPHLVSSKAAEDWKNEDSSSLDKCASSFRLKEERLHFYKSVKEITETFIDTRINSIQSLILIIKDVSMTKDAKKGNKKMILPLLKIFEDNLETDLKSGVLKL
jgi:hypothetical protein